MSRVICMVFALGTSLFAAPQASDSPPVPTIHAQTRVVQIEIFARDSHGRPVADLTKKDFIVTDQGKPRAIDIFSAERDVPPRNQPGSPVNAGRPGAGMPPNVFSNRNPSPRPAAEHSTVILLDHVNGNSENAAIERQGVLDLLNKVRPDERIALYVIGKMEGIILLQDYTTNRDLLLKSMRSYVPRYLDPPSFPQAAGAPPPIIPLPTDDTAEDVRLSLQSLAEHLALVPGRKNIYWVSRGFPAFQMHGPAWQPKDQSLDLTPPWQKTMATLNEADVALNAVDANPRVRDPVAGPALLLKQLSEVTGGHAVFAGSHDMGIAMAEAIDETHTTYTLGFYLAEGERDDKFHDLKVQTTRSGIQLSYREGYYAGDTELPALKPAKSELLESALLNEVDSHDVGIMAKVDITPGVPRATVNVHMNLDSRTLSLKQHDNGWTGKIDEMFVELNESGGTLAKISDTKDFEFTGPNRDRFDNEGVVWPMSIPLAPGAVKLAIIVRDTSTGRVGSLTVPII